MFARGPVFLSEAIEAVQPKRTGITNCIFQLQTRPHRGLLKDCVKRDLRVFSQGKPIHLHAKHPPRSSRHRNKKKKKLQQKQKQSNGSHYIPLPNVLLGLIRASASAATAAP